MAVDTLNLVKASQEYQAIGATPRAAVVTEFVDSRAPSSPARRETPSGSTRAR